MSAQFFLCGSQGSLISPPTSAQMLRWDLWNTPQEPDDDDTSLELLNGTLDRALEPQRKHDTKPQENHGNRFEQDKWGSLEKQTEKGYQEV